MGKSGNLRVRFSLAMILIVMTAATAGCAERVSYVGEQSPGGTEAADGSGKGMGNAKDNEPGVADEASDGEAAEDAATGLMKQLDVEHRVLTWNYKQEQGDYSILFSGITPLPDTDGMSVVNARLYTTEEKDRERIAKALFGSTVYDYSDAHKDRELLERRLMDAEEIEGHFGRFGGYDFARKEKERYEKALASAQTEPVPAADWSGTDYCGSMGGLEYTLSFVRYIPSTVTPPRYTEYEFANLEDAAQKGMTFLPEQLVFLEVKDGLAAHAPAIPGQTKELKLMNTKTNFEIQNNSEYILAGNRNLCTVTAEEAAGITEALLERLGLTGLVQVHCTPMIWEEFGEEEHGSAVADGWQLVYEPGNRGEALIEAAVDDHYGLWRQLNDSDGEFLRGGYVNVFLNDDGILSLTIENMLVPMSAENDVELLTVEQITQIAIRYLEQELASLDNTVYYTWNQMTDIHLGYWRISSEEENRYTFVPAWQFREQSNFATRLVINAMDGSILVSKPGLLNTEDK